ncbi:MAG: patatin-like phospholipase family protein [Polyangiaceae bacterium]|nr:patatin-like phospholipase family protein [Polyangiaceae bacterium]
MGKTIRVLSIDGGGIRGIIPATVLAQLEQLAAKPISALFDLIAGTSTGGILALGLSAPGDGGMPKFTARELVDLYLEEGSTIFHRSLWKIVGSGYGVADEKYGSEGVEAVLKRRFGERRLSETLTPVLVPAYEIERRAPFIFKSSYARRPPGPKTYDFPLWQVARATSAAPTYFEPCEILVSPTERYALVDGGVYANNPAMCAWAEVQGGADAREEVDVLLVSLGTGELCRPILYSEAKDWGLLGWARPVLDVMFDGSSDVVDYQMRQLLRDKYFRLQTRLEEGFDDMDDASKTNLRVLQMLASKLVEESMGTLRHLADLLSSKTT